VNGLLMRTIVSVSIGTGGPEGPLSGKNPFENSFVNRGIAVLKNLLTFAMPPVALHTPGSDAQLPKLHVNSSTKHSD
jgi:hypothetical protein